MTNFVFHNAKGKVAYYATLPETDDALIAVPIMSAGIQSDLLMISHSSLDTLLSVSDEQTTLGRRTLSSVTSSLSGSTVSVSADDFTYTAASGAPIAAIVVCYVPSQASSTDSDIIPLTKHDFSAIPSGIDLPVQISANGLFTATS